MQNRMTISLRRPQWKLVDYCALYIILWAITPALSRGDLFRYLAVGASVICLLSFLPRKQGKASNYAVASLVLIFLFVFHCGYIAGNMSSVIPRGMNLFVFCMIGIISIYYCEKDRKKITTIAGWVLAIYTITAIPSLIALQSNQWVLRSASGLSVRTGIEVFAGAYGYAYGCLFLVVLLLYDLRVNDLKKSRRTIELVLVVLFSYIVVNAGFTTALVLLVVGVFAALFFPKKNVVAATIVMILAAVILMKLIPAFLRWIITNFQISDVYRAKLYYLSQLTDSSSGVNYADSTRGGMFFESLAALSKYPVLGSVILSGREAGTGHAVLLDTLVNYGILYFLLYLHVIILTPWRLMKADKTMQMIYLAMIVLLGLTNTIDYATMVIPLFIGPMIVENALNQEREEP